MLKAAKRVLVFVVGSVVIAVGVAMIVLPGPAVVVIPAGLAILAVEFLWAQRLLAATGRLGRRVRVLVRTRMSPAK